MRKALLVPAVLVFVGLQSTMAEAQEIGATVSLTGCLTQETDAGETDLLLTNVASEVISAGEVELVAGEGVNLKPHVGHTVEATGTLVADEDDGAMEDDAEAEEEDMGEAEPASDDEESELVLKVTGLKHVSASCDSM